MREYGWEIIPRVELFGHDGVRKQQYLPMPKLWLRFSEITNTLVIEIQVACH